MLFFVQHSYHHELMITNNSLLIFYILLEIAFNPEVRI